MVLNTKQKDLGRSRLSLIFGSCSKLVNFLLKIFAYPSFYDFFSSKGSKKKFHCKF
jgi:hypothetical protein